jgi:hypothetical protein
LRAVASGRKWPIKGYAPPESFEAIGEKSPPKNYLAVVYVDLDRLGRYIRDNSLNECLFERLSTEINEAVTRSAYAGCEAVLDGGGLAEPLLVGGDDGVVAISAGNIETFVQKFHETFKQARFSCSRRPTYSMGVAIAHSHFPIYEFRRVAEDLLRSAKRIAFEGNEKPDSIDFEVITASMAGAVVRQRETARRRSGWLHRTAKPYQIDDFLELAGSIRALKDAHAPSSKLKTLYATAYEARSQAELDYLTLLSRLEPRHADPLRGWIGGSFWRTRADGGEETRAADWAEIYEFIH